MVFPLLQSPVPPQLHIFQSGPISPQEGGLFLHIPPPGFPLLSYYLLPRLAWNLLGYSYICLPIKYFGGQGLVGPSSKSQRRFRGMNEDVTEQEVRTFSCFVT